jgi:glycosyltransferase involved in cell wall biosynthesis
MPKISACIISYNEEERLEPCLESLVGVADEIVIVDSFSTDRTLEIARRYTSCIHGQAFLGYIEQKALAYRLASHDWILNLDCDERLSPELRDSILAEKGQLGSFAAYEVTRRTFYAYRFLDHCWYPEYRARLFDRRRCHSGGKEPHDKVVVDEGRTGRLRGDLLHYSFLSVSAHLKTLNNFTEIAAQDMFESGKRVGVLDPLLHGSWTFLRTYLVKRGFLDGFAGLLVSVLSGVHSFVKYAKVITAQRGARWSHGPSTRIPAGPPRGSGG